MKQNVISPVASVILGALFVFLQGGVIDLTLKVVSVLLLVFGILELLKKRYLLGFFEVLFAVVLYLIGWKLINVALYVVDALVILYGVFGLFEALKHHKRGLLLWVSLLAPLVCILAGVALFIWHGTILSWMFIVVGVCLIINGALSMAKQ